ncbi:histidine kinase [Caballeronia temeraria]|uniref:histidine kinase n=1 Tax=Caballeronia temeraria TaxID=1777137 RepID=A0A158DF21_9BURK|nr:response regulator [Caballeronia temeraria]SAK93232.1 histidine kinase [Caballeronia temeraria]
MFDTFSEDKVSILVVDDLASQHVVLRTVLEEPDQEVITVSSGREALKAVLQQDFAVILLDVNMPDMDGFETASMLRSYRRTASTPIIFLTAYVDDAEMARGYSLGAVDYISSPVVPEILSAKVRVFVQMHRMNRELRARAAQREELARAEAQRASADQARQRADFLAQVSHLLTRSLDVETTLSRILDTSVPALADVACVYLELDGEPCPRTSVRCGPAVRAQADPARGLTLETVAPLEPFVPFAKRTLGSAESLVCRDAGIFGWPSGDGAVDLKEIRFHPLLNGKERRAVIAFGAVHCDEDRQPAPVITEFVSRASIALDNAFLYSALRDEDRRKNEFLAMLAHELRNPLAPISNAVSVMKRSEPGDAKVASWATGIISNQLEHMVRIVDDLLDVSRIARGTVALQRKPLSLGVVIDRAIETSRPHFAARSQAFTHEGNQNDLIIEGDVVRLTQIVANLLNNASKFTPPGGHIILSTTFRNGVAVVTVTDNGEGIEPKLLPRVFDLFAQGNTALDRAQGGLGIGLTLARHLVELHGGSIRCWSGGRGKGSKFTVELPASVSQEKSPSAADILPLRRKHGARILVVDDSIASTESLKIFLEMHGHEVRCAHDGIAALSVARTFAPQVAILDIGLPGMNGYEIAKAFRADAALKDCLLIALSGYGQDDDRQKSHAAGIDHHLIKPADLPALVELISTGCVASGGDREDEGRPA